MSCCCWPSRGNTTVRQVAATWRRAGPREGCDDQSRGRGKAAEHPRAGAGRAVAVPAGATGPRRVRDLAARAVPDLLEEMVQRTLDDNGAVTMIRDAPFSVAAKLRFPVTGRESAAARPAVAQATIDAR